MRKFELSWNWKNIFRLQYCRIFLARHVCSFSHGSIMMNTHEARTTTKNSCGEAQRNKRRSLISRWPASPQLLVFVVEFLYLENDGRWTCSRATFVWKNSFIFFSQVHHGVRLSPDEDLEQISNEHGEWHTCSCFHLLLFPPCAVAAPLRLRVSTRQCGSRLVVWTNFC